jgi:hypothetical protein
MGIVPICFHHPLDLPLDPSIDPSSLPCHPIIQSSFIYHAIIIPSIIIISSMISHQFVQEKIDEAQGRWVCQQYLSRPLLLDRRKFDLRVYVIVVSHFAILPRASMRGQSSEDNDDERTMRGR